MKPILIKNTAKKILLSLALLVFSFSWSGCEKDYSYVAPAPTITPGGGTGGEKTVFFATDIQPIFNASCTAPSCHGGTNSPALTAASSYNELISGGFINSATPASSELYRRITLPSGNPEFMPEGATPLSADKIAKILTWIQEGATNN
jgi:hypothetical protein